jgi:hypothetical protein
VDNVKDSKLSYDEDNSEEFDADADFSKDEGTYVSSHSSKLSEVERKLAQMEKDDKDLVALRLKNEGKDMKKPSGDSIVSDGGEIEDYSEGDFESGSEEDEERRKGKKEERGKDQRG